MANANSYDLGKYPGAVAGYGVGTADRKEMRLDWRRDPGESFSDFKIIIVKVAKVIDSVADEGTSKRPRNDPEDDQENRIEEEVTFHVHKCVIGIGKSEYFSTLLRTKIGNQQGESDCSRVELDPLSAAVFPMVLDHLYGISDSVKATTSNAVSLRSLADRFGIPDLYEVATEFIMSDLSIENAISYLHKSSFHHDEILIDLAVRKCAENFERLKREDIEKLNSDHFQRMVSSPHLDCGSEILSRQVAAFLKSHQNSTQPLLLQSLTESDKMPSIDPEVACFFLNLDDNYPSEDTNDSELTLKERSIGALSKECSAVAQEDDDFLRLTLKQKYEVAQRALCVSNSEIDDLNESISDILVFIIENVENGGKYLKDILSSEACTRLALFPQIPDFGYIQLNRHKYPDVIVSGAGIEAANGRYTVYESNDGVGAYRQGNFYLCRDDSDDENGGKEWQIYFCWGVLNLYYVELGSRELSDCERPLENGWQTARLVEGPAPKLKLA